MSEQNVRIRLSADTSGIQRDIKLIDHQMDELGSGVKPIDLGLNGSDLKEFVGQQRQFIDSFNSYISATANNTQKIISKLDEINKQIDRALRKDAEDVYQKKLKELEEKKKMLEAQLNTSNTGGGGTTGGGSSSGSGGSIPPSGSTGDSGLGDKIKGLGGTIAKLGTALMVGKAVWGYVSAGAAEETSIKSVAYNILNRTGMYGSDFSKARANAHSLGVGYGYSAKDTIGFQGSLMSRMGYTNKENLDADTNSLMAVSKSYGMDLSSVGNVAGKYTQTGVIKSGEQAKFANLLASSIREAGMTGRESEQLDVLDQINDNLEKNLVNVTGEGVTSALGLADMLAKSNENLKGQRGADMVSAINEGITGGGNKMDILMGWGTEFTGTEGRWALEEAKAKGVSDPENLRRIITNFEKMTNMSIDSAQGKLALKEQFGLTPEEVNELVKNAEAIRQGSYTLDLADAVKNGAGAEDVNALLDNYFNSEVSTEEQSKLNWENSKAAVGDVANSATKWIKDAYNGLTTGQQAGLGLGLTGGGAYVAGKGFKWGWDKAADAFTGAGKGSTGATGAASGVDDAARAAASSMDDAARAATGSLDDAARAVAGSADDVLGGASKAASGISKAGKWLGVVGIALEAISTGIDVKEALDRGDEREAASQVGGGVGSVAGGILGGIGAGALAGSIVPGIGNVAGAIIGGIGGIIGALLGNWGGEAAGGAIYDATTGEGGVDGSHATGNDYIPYDGYRAITHKGEAILTAQEASAWRQRGSEGTSVYAMAQQTKAFGQITEVNKNTVNQYAKLLDEESNLLDRREELYSRKVGTGANSASAYDPLSALLGDDQYNIGLTSNNLRESNSSGWRDKLARIFGFSSSSTGGSYGGAAAYGGYSGGGATGGTTGGGTAGAPAKLVEGSSLAEWTSNMIHGYEGNYGSINYDDNGAVSIGKIQWHASRAKDLLNRIKTADPDGFEAVISQYGAQALASALSSGDNWGSYTVQKGSATANAITALLSSETGKAIQDALMVSDVQGYLDKGMGKGITDPKALAFYADMVNQYGGNNKTINEKVIPEALANGGTLDALYQAAINNLSGHHKRRGQVYQQLLGADLNFQDKATGVDNVPYNGYKIRAHKGETLLTAQESKERREGTNWLERMLSPLSDLNKPEMAYAAAGAGSVSEGFNGKLEIVLSGSIEGMTPENQRNIVQAVVQQIKMQGGNSVLGSLNNAFVRVPH